MKKATDWKGEDGIVLKKMQFRPCIDIHNGKVKQIVGSSLKDLNNEAVENFVSEQDAQFYANMYKVDGIRGGHIILLNAVDSEYYEATRQQAVAALRAYPGGMQVGGGITAENASYYIEEGASHVIVTSYVFKDGKINYENLHKLVDAVGKEHVVLDLSCRYWDGKRMPEHEAVSKTETMPETGIIPEKRGANSLSTTVDKEKWKPGYYIVTDRWQKFTSERITPELLDELSQYCDEFLVHAVDVEGKQNGIEARLIAILGDWGKIPVTYAGGVHTFGDLEDINGIGNGKLHVTIGSALDLFGGELKYKDVLAYMKNQGKNAVQC